MAGKTALVFLYTCENRYSFNALVGVVLPRQTDPIKMRFDQQLGRDHPYGLWRDFRECSLESLTQ